MNTSYMYLYLREKIERHDKIHLNTFTQNTDRKKACFLASKYFFIPYGIL